jgi:hypothetical protein
MANKSDNVRIEEKTALLFSLAGVAIQQARRTDSVSSRRLFKVLANCVWDWSWIPIASKQQFLVSEVADLVWVPHRFGALGLVKPTIKYLGIPLQYGLFAHPAQLIGCGVYAKYNIASFSDPQGRPRVRFPAFISFEQQKHAGVNDIDLHFWPQLAGFYGALEDETLDALASCRTETAVVHSLWAQIVLWREDVSVMARILQDFPPDTRTPLQKSDLNEATLQATAAASQFGKKATYWRRRDEVLSKVHAHAPHFELGTYVPTITANPKCQFAPKIKAFLALEPTIGAANLLVQGLCAQLGLHDKLVDIKRAEEAVEVLNANRPDKLSFQTVAALWFDRSDADVGEFIEQLLATTTQQLEVAVDVPIAEARRHYKEHVNDRYPLPRLESPKKKATLA